jgi:predicted O-linked N-acetylglucosamine transferase (SPINDLY family)
MLEGRSQERPMDDAAIAAAFAAALARHKRGETVAAAAAYRGILRLRPDHADSLHLLGMITADDGDPAAGAALAERAIRLRPDQAAYHNTLAGAWQRLGRTEDAARAYAEACALLPRSPEIRNNLATVLCALGRHAEAAAQYRAALAEAPEAAEIWYNLATALTATGPDAEVAEAFARALALRPDHADAHYNYGRWLVARGRWAAAADALSAATALRPDHAASWCNLGIARQEAGMLPAAEDCYRRAIALEPGLAAAHYNLGSLLGLHGRADEAVACQARALAADPLHGPARLAACMAELPILYRAPEELAERRRRYAAALDRLVAQSGDPAADRLLADAVGTAQPFFLPYQGEDDRALQATYGGLICRVLAAAHPPVRLAPRPAAGERIRVGIVSGYFCRHTVWKLFLEGWLTQLDRTRFELIGCHTGHAADHHTAVAAERCDRFIQGLPSAAAWRQAIAQAAPHVLLYPEIGMDPVAAQLAAQRLAPVQAVAWGHPVTTGMPTMDYFLSSALMEPAEPDAYYTERLIRLPGLGLHYTPDPVEAAPADRAAFGWPADVPVYWSGQALYKYLPQNDAVFPRIARAVGPCRFVFIEFAKSAEVTALFRDRLARAFAAEGLEGAAYCVFLPSMSPERFAQAVGLADVVLDTIGWSGGKSALDALARDALIVTLPGRFMRGRHSAAIVRRIGCTETIADSLDDYMTKAVALGRDAGLRDRLRAAVARNKPAAFNDTESIRALETFLVEAV